MSSDEKVDLKRKVEDLDNGQADKKPFLAKEEPILVAVKEIKEEIDEDEEMKPLPRVKNELNQDLSRQCPYLDTIDRNVLDFGM
jgi:hypothetical protein